MVYMHGGNTIVDPNYVWHIEDLSGPTLNTNLKRYYVNAPTLVELYVNGGTLVPDHVDR